MGSKLKVVISGSPEAIAEVLSDCARELTAQEFTNFLNENLVGVTTAEAEQIASHLPLQLQCYFPKRLMH